MSNYYEKLGAFYLGKEYDLASDTLKEDIVLYDSKDLNTHAVIKGPPHAIPAGHCQGSGTGKIRENSNRYLFWNRHPRRLFGT